MNTPSHRARIGAAVPGIVLRALAVAVAAALIPVVVTVPVWQVIALLCALIGAILPVSYAGLGAAACLVLGIAIAPADAGRTALAVLGVHALVVLAALNAVVPARGRIAVRALRPTLWRFLWMQAVAQLVAFAGVALLGGAGSWRTAWAAPVGALAVLGLALLLRTGAWWQEHPADRRGAQP